MPLMHLVISVPGWSYGVVGRLNNKHMLIYGIFLMGIWALCTQ